MKARTAAFALLVALVFAACGGVGDDEGPGSGGDGIEHPSGADELVLRVHTGGGFVPVEFTLREIPGFSLYGDGRLIVTGPVIEIYPGPALPNLQVTRLTEEGVQAILEEARRVGLLDDDASYDYPCVTDVPTTTFTVSAEGRTHTVSAYALGFEDQMTADCPDVDVEARAALSAFWTKLGDLESWLPEGSLGESEPFVPEEMRVYVMPYQGDPELEQEPIEWPLEGSPAEFGEPDRNLPDYRCGVVSGDDLDLLLPLAERANQLTPWVADGDEVGLVFRPLLPDEDGC
ncbi:MAG TPA: hypothetical protein VLA90_06695 [Actinomycetota bacterium]|nr:hypothetical protein [Actinomycetota bacterium]